MTAHPRPTRRPTTDICGVPRDDPQVKKYWKPFMIGSAKELVRGAENSDFTTLVLRVTRTHAELPPFFPPFHAFLCAVLRADTANPASGLSSWMLPIVAW